MTRWDLATLDNWQLILSETRIAQRKQPIRSDSLYEYEPISPIYTNPHSHVLLIGTYSETAKPYWFLGARASQYLYVSPSMNDRFISGVQTSDIKRIGLNRLTLVKFENYGVSPYALQLEIPYWIEDIYVEVWEYLDDIQEGGEQYQEMLDRLNSIEDLLYSGFSGTVGQ
ncbi:hypothetical protein IQ230_23490 [Gloeocapsopsis crepidinum LEGE 06123]|uniref:Uncharacterized protein n=1 Tax=Gloeocapsopsis crepidinum LEGE 06123 TaxID=588587 RepID=A0ABR9UY87_9CHRO|nr:hypothetical protein [Gloeocapsopsis crepidinum]MBE9193254.1 hypothetical protein [Gloeocapsopsis crepidinum LEGE 06123]